MISEEQRDAAIDYLGDTRIRARARLRLKMAQAELKSIEAECFLAAKREGATVAEAEAIARTTIQYRAAARKEAYADAIWYGVEGKREASNVICSQYQTDAADARNALR